jgi:hypothetical protein
MLNNTAALTVLTQAVRFLQLVGIPLVAVHGVIGMLILLTSGKNPRRKRMGYVISIGSFIVTFLICYVPALVYYYGGDTPHQVTGKETIQGTVNSSAIIGENSYHMLQRISGITTFCVFVFGFFVVACAGKNPVRKRLGLGFMMFSPIVLALSYLLPSIIQKLTN